MGQETYHFRKWYIPERMMPGIRRYVDHGIAPGRFLTAVIQNSLSEAVGRADDENLENIPAFAAYFYNECPGQCWGSQEKMEKWIKSFTHTNAPIVNEQEKVNEVPESNKAGLGRSDGNFN